MRMLRIIAALLLLNTGILTAVIISGTHNPGLIIWTLVNVVGMIVTQVTSFIGACEGE